MNNYRQLAPAAYLVAAALVIFPLNDSGVNLIPWTVGNAQWRFGAIGVLSNTLMIVCLGALIAVGAAVLSNQPRARRALGAASWVMAVLLLVAIGGFALDAVQARRLIRADLLSAYQMASITAEVKLLMGVLTFATLGRATRIDRASRPDAAIISPGLVGKQRLQV
ncbi:MAG: hypothetical protein M3Z05_16700 [Gemmatimonadota bacterium]|nr:hypothetical protein [Gemmatimonadota bacterium]